MITTKQIAAVRTSAKNLRAAGFDAEADSYDFIADEMQAEYNEMERRRIAAKHAAVNPDDPRFDIHAAAPVRKGWISNTAWMVDGDDVTPEWMSEIWPTMPEIEY